MKTIEAPVIFSDIWLESNLYDIENALNSGYIEIDFTKTAWFELSSLLSLTEIIIKYSQQIKKINFIFSSEWETNFNDIKYAFLFLIESNFLNIINFILRKSNSEFLVFFDISNIDGNQLNLIKNKLAEYFNYNLFSNKLDSVLPLISNNIQNKKYLGIAIHLLKSSYSIDFSLFSPFGYLFKYHRDIFLIPITYLKKEEAKAYIGHEGSKRSNKNLFNDIDLVNPSLPTAVRNYLNELCQLWLFELIANAIDHGGDDILLSVRIGDWSLRDRSFNRKRILDEGYGYRNKFFEGEIGLSTFTFLDFYVLDSGNGFVSLLDSWKDENKKSKFSDTNIHILHRYALYPHSSCKKLNEQNKSTRITGLGVIAERIIDCDGLLSIKDKEKLTYFTRNDLAWITNQGRTEGASKSNFGHTILSVILPLVDEDWAIEQGIHNISFDIGTIDKYFLIQPSENSWPTPDESYLITEDLKNHHYPHKLNFSEILTFENVFHFLVDLTPFSNNFNKTTALNLIELIRSARRIGFFVSLFGVGISQIKLLQNIIQSRKKYTEIDNDSTEFPHFLLAPVITNDSRIFYCGNLTNEERTIIHKFFFESEKSDLAISLIFQGTESQQDIIIPIRSFERGINRVRGQQFINDLKKDRVIEEPVIDVHGNLLNKYYEVKTYLGEAENRVKWIHDVCRMIYRINPSIIIVDCAELREMISIAVKTIINKDFFIVRIHNGEIELPFISNREKLKCAVFLSCVYSGSTLKSIDRFRYQYRLQIENVIAIVDLSGRSRKDIESQIRCEYDRFAIASTPKKMPIKGNEPKYIATKEARLVPITTLNSEIFKLFNAYVPTNSVFAFLQQSSNVHIGHMIEHGHHYDVFIDVRKSITQNDRLGNTFRNLLQDSVAKGGNAIVYPEQSELYPIVSSVKFAPRWERVIVVRARHVFDDTYVWCQQKGEINLKNKHVIILDEGAYSCRSIYGMLKLVIDESPKTIDVIVLEKRLALKNYISNIKQLINDAPIDINFHCVIDIQSPSWSEDDCPYCENNYPVASRNPRRLRNIINVEQASLFNESDFILWFLTGIYSSRNDAIERIAFIRKVADDHQGAIELSARLILIHGRIIDKWNILDRALNLIRDAFAYVDITAKSKMIKLSGKSPNDIRWKYFKELFYYSLPYISKLDIYLALYEVIEKNQNWIEKLNVIANKRILPEKQRSYWKGMKIDVSDGFLPRAVSLLFSITKINRVKPHKSLGDLIKRDGFENKEVQGKISRLKIVLDYLDDTPIIKILKQAINEKQQLLYVLNDHKFIEKLTKEYSVRYDYFIKKLAKAVNCEDYTNCTEKAVRIKYENDSKEIPLICIQNWQCVELFEHFKDNQSKGSCSIDIEIIENVLEVECISEKIIDQTEYKNAKNSIRLEQIRKILESVSGKIEYDIRENHFLTRFKLRIVDYVKI